MTNLTRSTSHEYCIHLDHCRRLACHGIFGCGCILGCVWIVAGISGFIR
jgi:hypothetical protein